MFTEDKIPACACTAHPVHLDKRSHMKAVKETPEYVVFCCQVCTEISHIPTVQVRYLRYGREKAEYANSEYEKEKRRILGAGKRPRVGEFRVSEES